jgi:putative tryptophan/tyrosine transport system substrate-binding protein
MKRRTFITLLGAAATWPLAALAQRPPMPVVGFLRDTTVAGSEHIVSSFRQGLNETGFVEGQNVIVEFRWANNQLDLLPTLVEELVRRQVAVITTVGTMSAARAAMRATSAIPIVFGPTADRHAVGTSIASRLGTQRGANATAPAVL